VRLPRHDDVAGDGRRRAPAYDHAQKQAGVHEVAPGGAGGHDAEDDRGREEVGLQLDEEVHAPLCVVGEQDGCFDRAAGEEEDEGDTGVGDDGLLEFLMREGDLDLRGEEDDEADADEEPLAGDCFEESKGQAFLGCWC